MLVYKYKKDDYDDTITKLFIVEPFLEKNIKEIFENANKREGGHIFSKLSDRIIGKIFEEIDNRLFNEKDLKF